MDNLAWVVQAIEYHIDLPDSCDNNGLMDIQARISYTNGKIYKLHKYSKYIVYCIFTKVCLIIISIIWKNTNTHLGIYVT